jgi:hypothetical protein
LNGLSKSRTQGRPDNEVIGVRRTTMRAMTHRSGFAVAFVAVAVAAIALMPVFSQSASAATMPKAVVGFIVDNAGNPLEDALVVVNIRDKDDYDNIRATDSFTTESNGYYALTFAMDDWDVGDWIQVIATWESIQAPPNETVATSAPFQVVWVEFPFEIPQFGSALGTMVAIGAVGAVGAVFVVSRKRRKDD